jgi:hypothetical protein
MMAAITCPSCGTEAMLERVTRSADEFCRKCDYPLFWAPIPTTLASLEGEEDSAETTLRRLPGANGRRAVASIPCPTCAELNPPTSLVCHRCNGPMVLPDEPEPEPEPEAELEPMPAPEPIEIPEERSTLWWWIALALGLVIVTVAVILLAA